MRTKYHGTERGKTPLSAAQDAAERPAGSTAALLDVPSSPSVGPEVEIPTSTTPANLERKYNGWANYETWVCKLWMDNEQNSYLYWAEAAREAVQESDSSLQVRRGIWSPNDAPQIQLANRLKQEVTDAAPDLGASLYADLLFAGLSEIDWFEIADALLDDHGGEDGHE